MKRIIAAVILTIFFAGCTKGDAYLERGLALREKMLQTRCSFTAKVTADYGDKLYNFAMKCISDTNGAIVFTVAEPESISGITGRISGTGGSITFDETVLAFELLADGEVSPVSAPWLLIKTLRSGYLTACAQQSGNLRLTIDDSYEEDALQLDILLNSNDLPKYAEILWQGRRVLSIAVEDFAFM